MAVEAKRGCGFRKAGGIYLVGEGLSEPCERLPIPLLPCKHCGMVLDQSRGFQWLTVAYALKDAPPCNPARYPQHHHDFCPVCHPENGNLEPAGKFGLMWVGEKYYPTPEDWAIETAKLGASKRVPTMPKEAVIGKTMVLVAHPKAIGTLRQPGEDGKEKITGDPGIFHAFRLTRIEVVATPSMAKQDWVKDLVKKGATVVEVPEDDPDHAPNVSRKSARKRAMDRAARKAEREPVEVE